MSNEIYTPRFKNSVSIKEDDGTYLVCPTATHDRTFSLNQNSKIIVEQIKKQVRLDDIYSYIFGISDKKNMDIVKTQIDSFIFKLLFLGNILYPDSSGYILKNIFSINNYMLDPIGDYCESIFQEYIEEYELEYLNFYYDEAFVKSMKFFISFKENGYISLMTNDILVIFQMTTEFDVYDIIAIFKNKTSDVSGFDILTNYEVENLLYKIYDILDECHCDKNQFHPTFNIFLDESNKLTVNKLRNHNYSGCLKKEDFDRNCLVYSINTYAI